MVLFLGFGANVAHKIGTTKRCSFGITIKNSDAKLALNLLQICAK